MSIKYTDEEYINYDPFFGDEADLKCVTTSIRKANKDYVCYGLSGEQKHLIHKGDRYRHEKAFVDDSFWGEYRICLKCMGKFIGDMK